MRMLLTIIAGTLLIALLGEHELRVGTIQELDMTRSLLQRTNVDLTRCDDYVQAHEWSVQPKCGVGHMAVWGENGWDCIGKRVSK